MLHEIYTVIKHCQGENFYKQDRYNYKYVKILVRKKILSMQKNEHRQNIIQ